MVSTSYHNTCGVCGVNKEKIASIRGLSQVLVNFISVLICSPRLRFRLFFWLGCRTVTRNVNKYKKVRGNRVMVWLDCGKLRQ